MRFLVGVQHRPATSTLAAYLAVLALGAGIGELSTKPPMWAFVVFATCTGVAVAEVGARSVSLWSRVVTVGLGLGTMLPITYFVFREHDVVSHVVAAATLAMPIATVALAGRTPVLGSAACAVTAAVVASGLPLVFSSNHDDATHVIAFFACWLSAIQVAFHAAAASQIRIPAIVVGAASTGAACGAAIERLMTEDPPDHWIRWLAGAWIAGSLLVPLARLGRSFTAVPLDHPIHTDFGGPKAR